MSDDASVAREASAARQAEDAHTQALHLRNPDLAEVQVAVRALQAGRVVDQQCLDDLGEKLVRVDAKLDSQGRVVDAHEDSIGDLISAGKEIHRQSIERAENSAGIVARLEAWQASITGQVLAVAGQAGEAKGMASAAVVDSKDEGIVQLIGRGVLRIIDKVTVGMLGWIAVLGLLLWFGRDMWHDWLARPPTATVNLPMPAQRLNPPTVSPTSPMPVQVVNPPSEPVPTRATPP